MFCWWSGLRLRTAYGHPGYNVGKGHVRALYTGRVVEGGLPGQFCLLLLKAPLSMFSLQLVVHTYSSA